MTRDTQRDNEIAMMKAEWTSKEENRFARGFALMEEFYKQYSIKSDSSENLIEKVSVEKLITIAPCPSLVSLKNETSTRTLRPPNDPRDAISTMENLLQIYFKVKKSEESDVKSSCESISDYLEESPCPKALTFEEIYENLNQRNNLLLQRQKENYGTLNGRYFENYLKRRDSVDKFYSSRQNIITRSKTTLKNKKAK